MMLHMRVMTNNMGAMLNLSVFLLTMSVCNILTLFNIGGVHNVHTRHVPDVLVSCGTGGPSCHGNEDHLSIHDELGQPHAWQERLHHRQDWWRGGVLGLAF